MAFKERPTGEQGRQADIRPPQLMAGQLPARIPQDVAAHGALRGQRGGKPREQLIEDLPAARVQAMQMPGRAARPGGARV